MMTRFSGAWRQNDDKVIAGLIAREGATIETTDGRLGPLGPRQAAAVLRTLFQGRDTRSVQTRQMHDIGGTPKKAYAEVIWTTLAAETTQPLRVVVFVEWRSEERRVGKECRCRWARDE